MSNTHTEVVEFDTAFPVIGEALVTFTRTASWGLENYGADADGRRGMLMMMLDNDEASNILVTWGDEQPQPLETFPESLQALVVKAVDTYIYTHEIEPVDDPERDPDEEREFDDG